MQQSFINYDTSVQCVLDSVNSLTTRLISLFLILYGTLRFAKLAFLSFYPKSNFKQL